MKKFTMILMASTAMAISTPAWSADFTHGYNLSEEKLSQSYFQSGYEWCDVRLVAQYFETDDNYQAKLWIGGRTLAGDVAYAGNTVEDILEKARYEGHACTFAETDFTMEDAEMVASVWELGGMAEAKAAIASLVTQGRRQQVIDVVGHAY